MKAYMSVSQFEREYHIGRPEDYDATLGHGSYTRRNAVAASVEEARRILAETEQLQEDIAGYRHLSLLPIIGYDTPGDVSAALAESLAAFVAE
jgi:hypothetical protein